MEVPMSQSTGGVVFLSAVQANEKLVKAFSGLQNVCSVESQILMDAGDCWNVSAIVTRKSGFLKLFRKQSIVTVSGNRFAVDNGMPLVLVAPESAEANRSNPEAKPRYGAMVAMPGGGITILTGQDLDSMLTFVAR
jgi:hypothetical protein